MRLSQEALRRTRVHGESMGLRLRALALAAERPGLFDNCFHWGSEKGAKSQHAT